MVSLILLTHRSRNNLKTSEVYHAKTPLQFIASIGFLKPHSNPYPELPYDKAALPVKQIDSFRKGDHGRSKSVAVKNLIHRFPYRRGQISPVFTSWDRRLHFFWMKTSWKYSGLNRKLRGCPWVYPETYYTELIQEPPGKVSAHVGSVVWSRSLQGEHCITIELIVAPRALQFVETINSDPFSSGNRIFLLRGHHAEFRGSIGTQQAWHIANIFIPFTTDDNKTPFS
jgi:hypothetical protein